MFSLVKTDLLADKVFIRSFAGKALVVDNPSVKGVITLMIGFMLRRSISYSRDVKTA